MRIYDSDDQRVKLELKQKCGIYQQKQSLVLEKSAAEHLIKGDLSPLEKMDIPLTQQLRNMMILKVYRPKCIVEYRRFAYVHPNNNIRITFDSQLRGSTSEYGFFSKELRNTPVQPPGNCIMEVKYDNFMLSYIKDAISKCSVAQSAMSKYCIVRELTLFPPIRFRFSQPVECFLNTAVNELMVPSFNRIDFLDMACCPLH